jgi:hypothetical protein
VSLVLNRGEYDGGFPREPARRIREQNLRFLDTGPADGPPS